MTHTINTIIPIICFTVILFQLRDSRGHWNTDALSLVYGAVPQSHKWQVHRPPRSSIPRWRHKEVYSTTLLARQVLNEWNIYFILTSFNYNKMLRKQIRWWFLWKRASVWLPRQGKYFLCLYISVHKKWSCHPKFKFQTFSTSQKETIWGPHTRDVLSRRRPKLCLAEDVFYSMVLR